RRANRALAVLGGYWPRYRRAAEAYEALAAVDGVRTGPVAEAARAPAGGLRRRRRQGVAAGPGAAGAPGAGGWGGGGREAAAGRDRLFDFRSANAAPEQAADRYDAGRRYLAAWWSRLAPGKRAEVQAVCEDDAFTALTHFRDSHPGDDYAADR